LQHLTFFCSCCAVDGQISDLPHATGKTNAKNMKKSDGFLSAGLTPLVSDRAVFPAYLK